MNKFEVGDIIKGLAYTWTIVQIDDKFIDIEDQNNDITSVNKNSIQARIDNGNWTYLPNRENAAKRLIKELLNS